MRYERILSGLALSLALLGAGCAGKTQGFSLRDYELYDSSYNPSIADIEKDILDEIKRERTKRIELCKVHDAWQKQREKEQKIRDKYRKALFFFTSESKYENNETLIEQGHGNVVGKEYVTVEHWIDKEIKRKVDGKEKIFPLVSYKLYLNDRQLERVKSEMDYDDRAIYRLPRALQWLENDLEMKDDVKLQRGDEVFWWGNPFNSFIASGKPDYREARIAFFENEINGCGEYIGLSRRVIPGDSGSLVVKKKTGEIVGFVHGNSNEVNSGLVISVKRYIQLKLVEEAKRENKSIERMCNSFVAGSDEWKESLREAMKNMK